MITGKQGTYQELIGQLIALPTFPTVAFPTFTVTPSDRQYLKNVQSMYDNNKNGSGNEINIKDYQF